MSVLDQAHIRRADTGLNSYLYWLGVGVMGVRETPLCHRVPPAGQGGEKELSQMSLARWDS